MQRLNGDTAEICNKARPFPAARGLPPAALSEEGNLRGN